MQARRRLTREFRRQKIEVLEESLRRPTVSPYHPGQTVRAPPPAAPYPPGSSGAIANPADPTAGVAAAGNAAAVVPGATVSTSAELQAIPQLHPSMHPAAARDLLEAHYYSSDAFCSMLSRQWHQEGPGSSSSSGSSGPAAYEHPFGRAITVALTRTKNWREVQSLVQEYADAMNSTHVCCALNQLAKLHRKQRQEQQELVLQGRHQQQLRRRQPEQLAHLVSQLVERVTEFQPGLSPAELAGAAWAAAELGVGGAAAVGLSEAAVSCSLSLRALRQEEKELPWRQRELGLDSCGMLLTAFVRLQEQQQQAGVEPQEQQQQEEQLLQAAQQVLEESLIAMQQQLEQGEIPHGDDSSSSSRSNGRQRVKVKALAQLGWGVAALQMQLPEGWLESLCQLTSQQLSCSVTTSSSSSSKSLGASARDVQMLLYSFAVLSEREQGSSSAAAAVDAVVPLLVELMVQPGVLQGLDDVGVSNTLWALGTLGHRPSETWFSRVLDQHEKSNMVQASAQSVSNTLWGLATLCVLPRRGYMQQLMQHAKRWLPVMTPQALSITLWAVAVLDYSPSEGWLSTFWSACSVGDGGFTTQGLVNLLWAVSRLKLSPDGSWLRCLLQEVQQALPELQPQAIANVVWSVAHMQEQQPQLQLPEQQQQLRGVRGLYQAALDRAVGVLENGDLGRVGGHQKQQFKALELASLLYSTAVVHKQQEQQHRAAQQQQEQQLPRSGYQHYTLPAKSEWVGSSGSSSRYGSSSSSSGWAGQPARPLSTPPPLAAAVAASSSSNGSGLSSSSGAVNRGWVGTLQGLEKLDGREAKVCRCALAALQPLLVSAGPQELANCLWSVVQLGLVPSRDWMGAWFHASLESMAQARPRDLAQYVWSLAKLGRYPPFRPWMAAFQVASYRKIESFDAQVRSVAGEV